MTTELIENGVNPGQRRAYQAPRLIAYGGLRELTQAGSSQPNENNSKKTNQCPGGAQQDLSRAINPNC